VFTEIAKPTQEVRITAQLRGRVDFAIESVDIAEEAVHHPAVVENGVGSESSGQVLDLSLEDLRQRCGSAHG
jgi:hypothetical protein